MDPACSYPSPYDSNPESSSPGTSKKQHVIENSVRVIPQPQDNWHAEDVEWNRHKEEIVRLYWEDDLPTRKVQEIMLKKHGFNKSVKMYKYRFKRWGIRKNIKKQEALELAGGQCRSSKFWPETRGSTYQHRIARHLKQKGGGRRLPESGPTAQRDWALVTIPGRVQAPDIYNAFESALYYADIYLGRIGSKRHSEWFSKPPALEFGEQFFDLFVQGMEDLSQDIRTQQAFADINNAFDNLKGLIATDHPLIYYRIASRIGSCKVFPSSQICIQLCRLLADYTVQMTRVIHGPSHPLTYWFAAQMRVIESGDLHFLENFLEISRMLSGKHLVAGKGLVHIAMYVPSDARGQDETALRSSIQASSMDSARISEAQEARLALAELLLGEGNTRASLPLIDEAINLKHLDPCKPSSKTFWISELLWRAGLLEMSIATLRETVELVKVEEELAAASADTELNYISVLHVLRSKLEWLRWEEELRELNAILTPLMERRGRPLKVRFVSSDLEIDYDTRYQSASRSARSPGTASPSLPMR